MFPPAQSGRNERPRLVRGVAPLDAARTAQRAIPTKNNFERTAQRTIPTLREWFLNRTRTGIWLMQSKIHRV